MKWLQVVEVPQFKWDESLNTRLLYEKGTITSIFN